MPESDLKRFSEFVRMGQQVEFFAACGKCQEIIVDDTGSMGGLFCPICGDGRPMLRARTREEAENFLKEQKEQLYG